MDDEWTNLRSALVTAVLIVAVVNAFFAQPVLRYANPQLLGWTGTLLGVGAAAGYVAVHIHRPKLFIFGTIMFLLGSCFAAETSRKAIMAASENDMQCLAVQRAMLFPKPNTRKDLPDVFAALGCRPQRL